MLVRLPVSTSCQVPRETPARRAASDLVSPSDNRRSSIISPSVGWLIKGAVVTRPHTTHHHATITSHSPLTHLTPPRERPPDTGPFLCPPCWLAVCANAT